MVADRWAAEIDALRAQVIELERRLERTTAATAVSQAVDVILEGIQIVDEEFRYIYVNDVAARQGRSRPADLVNRTIMECYPGVESTTMFAVLRRVMNTRKRERLENRFVFDDGSASWFELLIEPVPQGLLILSVDVSDRKRLEEQAERREQDLAAILDCMADAVIVTDAIGVITRQNPAAERLTGWSGAEATGRSIDELMQFSAEVSAVPLPNPVHTILREGAVIGLANGAAITTKSGTRVPVASTGAPLRDRAGTLVGVVLAIRDVSKEHQLRRELEQAQMMETVGRLAGGVAHDFNNALSVIFASAELAAYGLPADHEAGVDLQQIKQAAQHAAGLTRQLLALSRRQVIQPKTFDLNEALRDMTRMLRRVAPERIELVLRVCPGLARVHADRGQIEQVIMNLAVNGIDAISGNGRLILATDVVELDANRARERTLEPGRYVVLSVTDDGHGMDEATRVRVFQPFFTTKERGRGTGLGLSTVYGIVQQSGGHVSVRSELGRGTVFEVYLAFAAKPLDDEAPRAPTRQGGDETVLVVEDDQAVRLAAARVLARHGYRVLTAANLDEALGHCRAGEQPIDLLLTDVMLPGSTGREVAQAIEGQRPGLKTVYMSGYTEDVVVRDSLLGARFVEKPFSPESLHAAVRGALDDA